MPSNHPHYISTLEFARYLGVSPMTVLKRIHSGAIEARKIGRSYAIPADYIQKHYPDYEPSTTAPQDCVSVMEAAEILGISRIAVFKKIKSGVLKARRVGRHYVIDRADLPEPGRAPVVPADVTVDKDFVSVPELAELLGKGRATVARWAAEGRIRAKKIGRHYVVAREDIPVSGEPLPQGAAPAEEYLSVMDAARELGISRVAVFNKIKNNLLPAIKIGRSYAIEAKTLRSFFIDKEKE